MSRKTEMTYIAEKDFEAAMEEVIETEEVYRGMSVENIRFCSDLS